MSRRSGRQPPVAKVAGPLIEGLFGGAPSDISIRWWDGSFTGSPDAMTSLVVRSPAALVRLAYAPNELGLARAYVSGELDVEGDIFEALSLRDGFGARTEHVSLSFGTRDRFRIIGALRELGALRRPLPPPPEEARLRGRRHSRSRDAAAISHHYDVSNDFYRLVLGPTMTYSCAYFPTEGTNLDDAQTAKYDLICRKLGLKPGMRLLDVGCGWGGMVMHAVATYDVAAVGITISEPQAELAEKRVAEAGLSDRIQIRLQDYRDVSDGPFDAISSIGMFEHVGVERLGDYFGNLYAMLRPAGRLLNHAISRRPGRAGFGRRSFIARYIFPDGELQEVGSVVSAMQRHGFEVRDVESLREHYARTLRTWVGNLESKWEAAVKLAGNKARIWRLYMAGSAFGFECGRINIHQVLGVRTTDLGISGMPATRNEFV